MATIEVGEFAQRNPRKRTAERPKMLTLNALTVEEETIIHLNPPTGSSVSRL
jgi:hypothetical protein